MHLIAAVLVVLLPVFANAAYAVPGGYNAVSGDLNKNCKTPYQNALLASGVAKAYLTAVDKHIAAVGKLTACKKQVVSGGNNWQLILTGTVGKYKGLSCAYTAFVPTNPSTKTPVKSIPPPAGVTACPTPTVG